MKKTLLSILIINIAIRSFSQSCTTSITSNPICLGKTVTITAQSPTFNCSSMLPASLQASLVAYYPFCGNANDVFSNNYNGTVTGATLTTDRFGNPNSSYSFNGTSDFITTANSSTINFPSGVTFAAWIKPTAYKNASIVDKMLSTGSGFRIDTRENTIPIGINPKKVWAQTGNYLSTGTFVAVSTSDQILSTWQFVVGTYGLDDTVRIYFNGVLEQKVKTSLTYTANNNSPILIGRGSLNPNYENFNGLIDDVSIFKKVLTPAEISSLYNVGTITYSWSTSSTASNIVVSPTITTTYTVNSSNGFNSCNSIVTLTVDPGPSIIANSSSSILCIPNSATITAGGASTYTWSTSSNSSSIVVSPSVNTTYTINASSINGCTNVVVFTQSVSSCAGIQQINLENNFFKLYPNPSNGKLTIELAQTADGKIIDGLIILDVLGRKVLEQKESTTQINIEGLNKGIYQLLITSEGKSYTSKFIKE